ncbi:hypothetical protein GCAAIG_01040 [Candidatus Electronema halotolerans]
MQQLAFFYGLFLPFTSVFALSMWINLPILIGMIIFFLLAIKGKYIFNRFDVIVFILFVSPIFFSAIVNIEYASEERYRNHILSYLTVYFLFYFVSKELLRNYIVIFFRGIVYGLSVSLLFEFVEFFIAQTPVAYQLDNIPRFAVQQYQPLFHGIVRARSVVEESGHYALYLGVIGSLSLWFLESKGIKKFSKILKMGIIFGILLTFSTSGIIFGILSLFFVQAISRTKVLVKKISFLISTIIFFAAIYFFFLKFYQLNLINLYIDKKDTMGGRKDFFLLSLDCYLNSDYLNLMFGLGPGYYDYLNLPSVISLTALTLFQTGLIGLLMYIILMIVSLKRVNLFHKKQQSFFVFAICFSFLVYNGISNYWYPWIWVLFATLSIAPELDESRRIKTSKFVL